MSKLVKIGLCTISNKYGDRKCTYRVKIDEEYPNGKVLVTPIEHVSGQYVEMTNTLYDKSEITGVIEKTVSNWKYFWNTY